ncbi:receptor protein kinase CLAVATA1 [Amborella trichopoda]|uniref:non-specific serine/threonine protein kinase n=1 Tax=Amborella trichopoda TaxID=13333 RepID=U5CXZ0_AMBTC|nr:receptor protein kinase CLAVATA1 [Amborella trichopoda]ERN18211.1 hypothetical protein AMTR_s00055p00012250 [Amborella trichopoda]|eukprot:XP_006856744.3 receptor protein kinase CLAVATA1 [Amborella trichopoda]
MKRIESYSSSPFSPSIYSPLFSQFNASLHHLFTLAEAAMHRFSFSLLFLALFVIICECVDDSEVLLKLKRGLILEPQKISFLKDWETGKDHCLWSGVTCNDEARVVALNICFIPLHGRIFGDIGLLDKLVNVTLSSSNLTGNLPPQIGHLRSLRFLNISNNDLSGDIPTTFSGLQELEVLDAYNNNFSGPLPHEVASLKGLRHLQLGGNYFSGEILTSYGGVESLEYLGLNGNALSGHIPGELSMLSNLREMYLGYYNSYSGGIPSEFGLFAKLVRLDLASCNLSGQIPATLGQLKFLDTLFLQMNRFSGEIPEELSGLKSVKSLDLSNNQLTGELPEGFSELRELTLLNLFRNNLHGAVPPFIAELPNLEVLQLWENNFTGSLPENLGRNGRLLKLDLTANRLTGLIPSALCFGGRFQVLILLDNYFFGPIPESLGICKSLTRVRLAKNFLNGSIPEGFLNLPLADMIELTDNYLSGKLPSRISASVVLGELILSNNLFTGSIPSSISNLTGLQTLSLEGNQFSGEIPQGIGELQQLSKLNLSNNKFSGKIPAALGRCFSLYSVDISNNQLAGTIPDELADLHILNVLNLSGNHLSGEIPAKMKWMQSLTSLDLSYNQLSGIVPTGGQFAAFNMSSFMGNPDLCGSPLRYPCSRKHVPSENGGEHGAKTSLKMLVSLIVLLALGVFAAVFVRMMKAREAKRKSEKAWKLTAFQRLDFSYMDVLQCLKEENMIGSGGAGVVYRGVMPSGQEVAIKRLRTTVEKSDDDRGFSAEIQTLGRIRHRHIVRLLGFCSNKETNLLVYEYMRNGSLGEVLHGRKGGQVLGWETRCRIAVEAATGLCYLHHDCCPMIIHRDVKSNNILLDSTLEAHVADFGLAKFMQDAAASQSMSTVAGSYGYIAPEYAYTLKVDEKTDVYSFGVVLLELITGRKPVGEFGEGVDLARWVRKMAECSPDMVSVVSQVVDTRLTAYPLHSVTHLFRVAMLCVEEQSVQRPTMREVVHMLTNPPAAPDLLSL